MKRWNKLFSVLAIGVILSMLCCIPVVATEPESEEVPIEPVLSLEDVTFVFKYTSDSVTSEGLTYQTYSDPISNQTGIELVQNFGLGYCIYDDAETEIIDGIRINGKEVTSLRIPIDAENHILEYEIAVRTVYIDNAAGSLAQILDGTFDYSQLITNPVFIFQLAYWVFMAIAGFVGLITVVRNRKIKAKTSDEIANKVVDNVDLLKQQLIDIVTGTVKSEILPLAQASVKSGKEAVKAILLSTSKSKDAPSALLDVFKESSDLDISNIVDEVREELAKSIGSHEDTRASNLNALHNIANNVIQEDVSNATVEPELKEPKAQKSIF